MWVLARGSKAHSGDQALLVTGCCYPGHRPEKAARRASVYQGGVGWPRESVPSP